MIFFQVFLVPSIFVVGFHAVQLLGIVWKAIDPVRPRPLLTLLCSLSTLLAL
jgi:hypothetical protein